MADSDVPGLEIDLDSWDGVVTLFGIVSSQEAKAAAEADALKVSGVKRVVNELQVVARAKQQAVNASDDELQHEVRNALDEHEFRDVGLEVKNGVGALNGDRPNRGAEPGGRSGSALDSWRSRGRGRSAPPDGRVLNPSNDFEQEEKNAMSGTSDKIKGRVKEAVGVLTDDQRLKNEGKLDQTTGKIKKTVERLIDNAKNSVKSAAKK